LIIRSGSGLVVTSKRAPTIGFQLYWDTNLFDATPDSVFSGVVTVTSTTSGTNNSTFNSTKYLIPPDKWVWGKVPTTLLPGQIPQYFVMSVFYSILNRKY
jgi:hypothetical protein